MESTDGAGEHHGAALLRNGVRRIAWRSASYRRGGLEGEGGTLLGTIVRTEPRHPWTNITSGNYKSGMGPDPLYLLHEHRYEVRGADEELMYRFAGPGVPDRPMTVHRAGDGLEIVTLQPRQRGHAIAPSERPRWWERNLVQYSLLLTRGGKTIGSLDGNLRHVILPGGAVAATVTPSRRFARSWDIDGRGHLIDEPIFAAAVVAAVCCRLASNKASPTSGGG